MLEWFIGVPLTLHSSNTGATSNDLRPKKGSVFGVCLLRPNWMFLWPGADFVMIMDSGEDRVAAFVQEHRRRLRVRWCCRWYLAIPGLSY